MPNHPMSLGAAAAALASTTLALGACLVTPPIPPVAPAPYAAAAPAPGYAAAGSTPSAAAPTDASLAAEAARLAGGADVTGAVAGASVGTIFTFEAEAGYCYDVAVVASDGTGVDFVLPAPAAERLHVYPASDGMTASGRGVVHPICADSAGPVPLVMRAHVEPALHDVRFAIAARRRAEDDAARAERRRVQRARFEQRSRAECDELVPSAARDCLDLLEAELAERDRRAAAR